MIKTLLLLLFLFLFYFAFVFIYFISYFYFLFCLGVHYLTSFGTLSSASQCIKLMQTMYIQAKKNSLILFITASLVVTINSSSYLIQYYMI